ncbi:MAG: pyridoxal phosphate-dependent aminotransferase family protein, partial [Leptolyngbyaceae cyanobacterium]
MEVVIDYVQRLHASGLYPDKCICHHINGNQIDLEEQGTGRRHQVLTFCTNDVLGMAQDDAVTQAAIDSIRRYGTSNSSCSVLSGRIDLHRQL